MNKEEQEFYKKLGHFITIMESNSKLDDVINNYPKNDRIKGFISAEMLNKYKEGITRISLYKLLKLSELYGYSRAHFMDAFDTYLEWGGGSDAFEDEDFTIRMSK
jgi:hypothetical protein